LSIFRFRRGGSTQYFTTGIAGTAKSTLAITANRLYAIPFFSPVPLKIDQLAIHVSTLLAGAARLGVYVDDGTIKPGKLIIDAGTVDTGTAGAKTLTVDLRFERKRLYWLALVANAAPTLGAVAVASALTCFFGLTDITTTLWLTFLYKTFTYAVLPDPFGDTLVLASGVIPAVFVRAVA
jgi:hypothetical protein